jgi:hypothetical protein
MNFKVKQRTAFHLCPACSEVLPVIWTSLLRSISMTGKNTQQIMQAIAGKVRTYHKLLAEYATTGKRELGLLLTVQVRCCCSTFGGLLLMVVVMMMIAGATARSSGALMMVMVVVMIAGVAAHSS